MLALRRTQVCVFFSYHMYFATLLLCLHNHVRSYYLYLLSAISYFLVFISLFKSSYLKGSVWASLPPIKNGSTEHPKPIILAITSQDSASFFRDRSIGSDSPISVSWYWFYIVEFILLVWIKKYFSGYSQGLIALLTAVDALSHIHDLSNLKKQVWYDQWNCVR